MVHVFQVHPVRNWETDWPQRITFQLNLSPSSAYTEMHVALSNLRVRPTFWYYPKFTSRSKQFFLLLCPHIS
jgi:hypothetical protein